MSAVPAVKPASPPPPCCEHDHSQGRAGLRDDPRDPALGDRILGLEEVLADLDDIEAVDAMVGMRVDEGCENAMALWREIREEGYPGTSRQVHRFVAERRTRPVRSGRKPRCAKASALEPPGSEAPLPPARQLAWLLVLPPSVLDEGEVAVVWRVEQDGTARALTVLARRFTALVRAAGKDKAVADDQDAAADFDAWITQARSCDAPAVATFASGLEADLAAVRAALTEPWSSGQVEGQINRLKLIKRQCYGRASHDLPKRCMVLAA